jgi:hypothetical protein
MRFRNSVVSRLIDFTFLTFTAALVCAGLLAASAQCQTTATPNARLVEAYGRVPLGFEPNRGQTDPRVRYLAHGPGYQVFLTPDEAVLVLDEPAVRSKKGSGFVKVVAAPGAAMHKFEVLRIALVGAKEPAQIAGEDELLTRSNYLIGNDRAKWHTGVPNYRVVRYQEVYPGTDVVYHGELGQQLEYRFELQPGADPRTIALEMHGSKSISIDNHDALIVQFESGALTEHPPIVYQEIGGRRVRIDGRYELRGGNRVGFRIAAYDHRAHLTIDPTLSYSTFLGGSVYNFSQNIAVDAKGHAYVTGEASSPDFPTTEGAALDGSSDAFVTEFTPNGSGVVFSTLIGGSGDEMGLGIGVGPAGNVIVGGTTTSPDFPLVKPVQSAVGGIFVSKLTKDGSGLVYSTYFGAPDDEVGDLYVDGSGNAYLTGNTFSTTFPTKNAFQPALAGSSDAFAAKFLTDGSLAYSTYLGGSDYDQGNGITADSSGAAYVTGTTSSSDFPHTAGAFQTVYAGNSGVDPDSGDAFVTKLNATGALVYSTYLGGTGDDTGFGIAVDSSGAAYVTGYTTSLDFPHTAKAFQTVDKGTMANGFVTKLNPAGSALDYSTFLGGSTYDAGSGIGTNSKGEAIVVGISLSTDLPVTKDAFQKVMKGTADAFVSKLDPKGEKLLYSTYLGGSGIQGDGSGIAIGPAGNAYIASTTDATDFPVTKGAFQTTYPAGATNAVFVSKFTFP